jgi:hypothetical protein
LLAAIRKRAGTPIEAEDVIRRNLGIAFPEMSVSKRPFTE